MQRIRYLEGLRGAAALMVVVHHYLLGFYPALYNGIAGQVHTGNALETTIARSPLNIIYSGNLAVCIFFVLSGYVLTRKYFESNDQGLLISGAIRRYFRLVIPIAVSTLIAYTIMSSALFYNQQAAKVTRSDWWLAALWSFQPDFGQMLKQGFFELLIGPSFPTYNTVLWTMKYEFYGSMLVFALALAAGRLKNRYGLYVLPALLWLNSYYSAFILGLILSDLQGGRENRLEKIKGKFTNVTILLAGLFLGSYPEGLDPKRTIYEFMSIAWLKNPVITIHIIAAFLILLAVLNSDFLKSFFSTQFFVFPGRISFSMYLLHVIVLGSFSSYVFVRLLGFFAYGTAFLIMVPFSMVVLISVSYLMHGIVDLNAIRFSRYFYQRVFSGMGHGPAPTGRDGLRPAGGHDRLAQR